MVHTFPRQFEKHIQTHTGLFVYTAVHAPLIGARVSGKKEKNIQSLSSNDQSFLENHYIYELITPNFGYMDICPCYNGPNGTIYLGKSPYKG